MAIDRFRFYALNDAVGSGNDFPDRRRHIPLAGGGRTPGALEWLLLPPTVSGHVPQANHYRHSDLAEDPEILRHRQDRFRPRVKRMTARMVSFPLRAPSVSRSCPAPPAERFGGNAPLFR